MTDGANEDFGVKNISKRDKFQVLTQHAFTHAQASGMAVNKTQPME